MYRISVLLLIGILLISCNGGQSGSQGGSSDGGGTFTAPIPPSANFRETSLLARDYWVFEFYVVPNDREASQAGKGRWYKFKPDGSFESGHWNKVMGSGSWGIGLRNEGVVLHIDFFNTLSMTNEEIQIMRYIYSMREEFMKAEGVAKVGAQIL